MSSILILSDKSFTNSDLKRRPRMSQVRAPDGTVFVHKCMLLLVNQLRSGKVNKAAWLKNDSGGPFACPWVRATKMYVTHALSFVRWSMCSTCRHVSIPVGRQSTNEYWNGTWA